MWIAETERSTCRSCGAPVVWVKGPSGKRNPIDPTPVSDGNIVDTDAESTSGGTPVVRYLKRGEDHPGPRYVSHFSTCPHADSHRKGH